MVPKISPVTYGHAVLINNITHVSKFKLSNICSFVLNIWVNFNHKRSCFEEHWDTSFEPKPSSPRSSCRIIPRIGNQLKTHWSLSGWTTADPINDLATVVDVGTFYTVHLIIVIQLSSVHLVWCNFQIEVHVPPVLASILPLVFRTVVVSKLYISNQPWKCFCPHIGSRDPAHRQILLELQSMNVNCPAE